MSEVLPEPPSPLGWDVVWEGAAVAGWRDLFVQRLGMQDERARSVPGRDDRHPRRVRVSGRVVVQGVGRPHARHDADHDRRGVLRRPSRRAALCRRGLARRRPNLRGDGRLAGMGDDRRHAGRAASRPRRVAANSRAQRPDYSELLGRGTAPGYIVSLRRSTGGCSTSTSTSRFGASIGPGILAQVCTAIGEPDWAMRLMTGSEASTRRLPPLRCGACRARCGHRQR